MNPGSWKLCLGVTGSPASGKSTVCAQIVDHFQAESFCADQVVASMWENDTDLLGKVAQKNPDLFLSGDLGSRKRAIRDWIFREEGARHFVENLVHRRVVDQFLLRKRICHGLLVVEMPLLFEIDLQESCDLVLCVGSSEEVQRLRLQKRQIPTLEAESMMRRQFPIAKKAELSDFVIWNDGELSLLCEQVKIFCHRLDQIKGQKP